MIILSDAKINGCGFLELDRDSLKELEVSVGFRLAVMKIIKDLVCSVLLITSQCCACTSILLHLAKRNVIIGH